MALYNKYKNEHYSENGTFWKLEILDSTLSSGNQDIEFDIGPEGVTVKWDGVALLNHLLHMVVSTLFGCRI